MDKINDYIKNLKFRNTIVGGYDKESVYTVLKDLVNIFTEEISRYEEEVKKNVDENKKLLDKIQEMKPNNKNLEKENFELADEVSYLKNYVEEYHTLEKKYDELIKEKASKDMLVKKMKGESEKTINDFKQKQDELLKENKEKDELIQLLRNNVNNEYEELKEKYNHLLKEIEEKGQFIQNNDETNNRIDIQQQNKDFINEYNNINIEEDKIAVEIVTNKYKDMIDSLTKDFIMNTASLKSEIKQLKEELLMAKKEKEEKEEFLDKINNLYSALDEIRGKYNKGE